MPCFYPLKAYRSKQAGASIVFTPSHTHHIRVDLPCSQCRGCRLEKSRQWAMRCQHEASLWERNCFLTLTYSPEDLPEYGKLKKDDLQKFFKKLRKRYCRYYTDEDGNRKCENPIRYYACGEYGDESDRPHYHVILFNFDFEDKEFWKTTATGDRLYISSTLESIWGHGFCVLGDVTFESAAYVARYVMKKQTKPSAKDEKVRAKQEAAYAKAYLRACPETGEAIWLPEEFCVMSRRPGIGRAWYDTFKEDVFPSDFVVVRGSKMNPPKFYDSILKVEDEALYDELKEARMREVWKHFENCSPSRLLVREEVMKARMGLYRREL